ncbi:MAG: cupin domain-containing protein [Candidatus Eremiobacteraeota bacterium]|nr:cupin domain-containing protein [Candidatus Eremiobacteraeota bacterium]
MKSTDREDMASLALGAISDAEAAELMGRLAADADLRGEYGRQLEVAGLLALTAEATAQEFSDERKERLKNQLLSAAKQTSKTVVPESSFANVVPMERLVQFGPGIRWTVLPGQGITTVYWIFEPPECGTVPWEEHDQTQSGFVLDGRYTMLYPDAPPLELSAGDYYAVPAGVVHGASFQTKTILCDVYKPVKEDFELLYTQQLAAAINDGE